jgi:hypothetical protein
MSGNENAMIQKEREILFYALIERLRHRGYSDLRVSRLERFEGKRPNVIFWEGTDRGFIPDASAVKDSVAYIFQIETQETLQSEDARLRMSIFSAYARHYHRHFSLVVSEDAAEEARRILISQGIDERFVHVVSA